jgi:hypothetical protein
MLANDYRLRKDNFHHESTVALVGSIINGAIAAPAPEATP